MSNRVVSQLSTKINRLSLYSLIGFLRGVEIVSTLRARAASPDNPVRAIDAEVLDLLVSTDGIDVSDKETKAMLSFYVTQGVLTKEEAEKISHLNAVVATD